MQVIKEAILMNNQQVIIDLSSQLKKIGLILHIKWMWICYKKRMIL